MLRIFYSIEALLAALFLFPFATSEWEFEISNSTLDAKKEKAAIAGVMKTMKEPNAEYSTIGNLLATSFDNTHPPDTNNRWWCVVTGPVFWIGGHIPIANSIQLSMRKETTQGHGHDSVKIIQEMHITLMELKIGRDINRNKAQNAFLNALVGLVFLLPLATPKWKFEITNSTLDAKKVKEAIDCIMDTIEKHGPEYNAIREHVVATFDKAHLSDPANNRWWCVVTGPVFSIGGHVPIANSIQLSAREEVHAHGSVKIIQEMHITLVELKFGHDMLQQAQNAFADDGGNALVGLIMKQLMEYGVWKSVSAKEIPELDPKTFLIYVDSLVEINQNKSVVLKKHSHSYAFSDAFSESLSKKDIKVPAIEYDPYLDYFFRHMDDKKYVIVDTRSLLFMMLLKQYLLAGKSTREMIEKLAKIASEAEKLEEKLKEELKDKYSSRYLALMKIIAGRPEKLFKALEVVEAVRKLKPGTSDFKMLTEAHKISEEVDILVNNKDLHTFMFETTEFVKSIVQHIREIVNKSNDQEVVKQKEFRASLVKYIIQSKSGLIGYDRKPVLAEYGPSEYVHWKVGKPYHDSLQEALKRSFEASKGYFAVVEAVNQRFSSDDYAFLTTKFELKSPCSKIKTDTNQEAVNEKAFNEKNSCKAYFLFIQRAINKMLSDGKLDRADLAKGILEWAIRSYDAFVVHWKNEKNEHLSNIKDAVKTAKVLIFKLLDDSPGNRRKKEGLFSGVKYSL